MRPQAHPPARPRAIARLENQWGISLPGSYRAFLELSDGYEELAYPGHMLSVADVLNAGTWRDQIDRWKKRVARGSGERIDGFVFANLGGLNKWAYLDPRRPGRGNEITIVEWDPEQTEEYPDLFAFLEECLATVRYGLKEAARNRRRIQPRRTR